MAARIEPLMTVDDLDAMPEDGNRYEVIEGELFVSRAPGLPHQIVSGNIFGQFWQYLLDHPVGKIIATPGLMLSQYSGVIPDLVFYTHARGAEIIADERLVAAPDIVIEILSPGRENVARDRIAKRQLYAKYGVNEYWIVDSENRSIEIYRQAANTLEFATILRNDDSVTSPLLSGFKCPVAKIFEP
ncbi:MAG TPA: Uma2 family endonuclease [Pyrinomonadaceae bacterium]|nr:Uma2 family endonuclease [Pyrinomonadaceae bacterium]